MAGTINSVHKRVSNNTGKNASKKTDGYARGPVPESALPTKPGKVEGHGYSGPDVAVPDRKF
jgi:hypothetical protein